MKASNRSTDVDAADDECSGTAVSTHEPTDGKTIFTEEGNTDGWIATDLTVTPEP